MGKYFWEVTWIVAGERHARVEVFVCLATAERRAAGLRQNRPPESFISPPTVAKSSYAMYLTFREREVED